jgi:hypothetical protein
VKGLRLSRRDGLEEEPDARVGNEYSKTPDYTSTTGLFVQESNPDAQHVKRVVCEDRPETVTTRIGRRGQLLAMRVTMEHRKIRDDQRCDSRQRLQRQCNSAAQYCHEKSDAQLDGR